KPEEVIWLHGSSVEEGDGKWEPLCESGPDGRQQAIPLAGRFLVEEGRFNSGTPSNIELACTSGAIGKCIRFGFHPWQTAPNNAQTKSGVGGHDACIRATRAHEGGDGTSTPRNGMLIDL